MRASKLHINTLKETPADAEVISHQLMLRAGLIQRLGSGLFSWMPLGLRVLRKVEQIVREEMNRAGAQELLMPAVQPAELWQETGRWESFGGLLLKMRDANGRDYCFGPTHEEVITDIARRDLKSYKQLPLNFYQIQNKFRDEIRPRFGVMRAREFLMKDAYSFHLDQASLAETYQDMYQAYSRIFTRVGLKFRAVQADSGAIGGNQSHEFHVLADSGEDALAVSDQSDYAANVEKAAALALTQARPAPQQQLHLVDTPTQTSISEICELLNVAPSQCLKTLIVRGEQGLVALVLRGDHELNTIKASQIPGIINPLQMANEVEIKTALGASPGFLGPLNITIPVIADHSALAVADAVCGANQDGKHFVGVNWERDLPLASGADLRNVVSGDPSPDGAGQLQIVRGIEVGHVFQLGDKYSRSMQATVLDEQGRAVAMQMGCYGIGVSRTVAAAIEQNHDAQGIIWPSAIAPFSVALIPINMAKSEKVRAAAEALYAELEAAGIEVLLDDRPVRPGVSFADMELIGIPHRLVLSEKGLELGECEYKGRRDSESRQIPLTELQAFLSAQLAPQA